MKIAICFVVASGAPSPYVSIRLSSFLTETVHLSAIFFAQLEHCSKGLAKLQVFASHIGYVAHLIDFHQIR